MALVGGSSNDVVPFVIGGPDPADPCNTLAKRNSKKVVRGPRYEYNTTTWDGDTADLTYGCFDATYAIHSFSAFEENEPWEQFRYVQLIKKTGDTVVEVGAPLVLGRDVAYYNTETDHMTASLAILSPTRAVVTWVEYRSGLTGWGPAGVVVTRVGETLQSTGVGDSNLLDSTTPFRNPASNRYPSPCVTKISDSRVAVVFERAWDEPDWEQRLQLEIFDIEYNAIVGVDDLVRIGSSTCPHAFVDGNDPILPAVVALTATSLVVVCHDKTADNWWASITLGATLSTDARPTVTWGAAALLEREANTFYTTRYSMVRLSDTEAAVVTSNGDAGRICPAASAFFRYGCVLWTVTVAGTTASVGTGFVVDAAYASSNDAAYRPAICHFGGGQYVVTWIKVNDPPNRPPNTDLDGNNLLLAVVTRDGSSWLMNGYSDTGIGGTGYFDNHSGLHPVLWPGSTTVMVCQGGANPNATEYNQVTWVHERYADTAGNATWLLELGAGAGGWHVGRIHRR